MKILASSVSLLFLAGIQTLAAQDKPAEKKPAEATPASPAPAAPAAAPAPAPAAPADKPAAPPMSEALQKAMAAAQKGDFDEALKLLKSEAEKGNADAMNALGEFSIAGRGAKQSVTDAQKWFQKAADANHPQAQFNLARLLITAPEGIKADPEKSEFLLRQAAEGGLAEAQFRLGEMMEGKLRGDGKGPAPDLGEPRRWYEKAAKQRHGEALLAMARYLDNGLGGLEKSADKAMESTYQAAQAGNLVAMNEMGVRYQKGLGLRPDNVAAVGWFLSAAEFGLPAALVNLGNCYETGNGVPKNIAKAGMNYSQAARQNFAPAQLLIARMNEEGIGTEKNLAYAYVNYIRAGKGGIESAGKKAEEIKKLLKPEELKMAEEILAGKIPQEKEQPKPDKSDKGAKESDKPKSKNK
jgi:TPR repeat protein